MLCEVASWGKDWAVVRGGEDSKSGNRSPVSQLERGYGVQPLQQPNISRREKSTMPNATER